MKEKLVIFLKRFGGYLLAFTVIGFWIWRFASGRESNKTWDSGGNVHQNLDANPRESLRTDTVYYRDITFILSTKIDTVFKTLRK